MNFYKGSLVKALLDVYPEVKFDLSKFHTVKRKFYTPFLTIVNINNRGLLAEERESKSIFRRASENRGIRAFGSK